MGKTPEEIFTANALHTISSSAEDLGRSNVLDIKT